jgi:isochorismate synthase EntC
MGDEFRFDKNNGQINIAKDNSKIKSEQTRNESKYNFQGGNFGAVGDNSKAENFSQYSFSKDNLTKINIDVDKILDELVKVRKEFSNKSNLNIEEKELLNNVKEAITGANEEDKGKVVLALKRASNKILPYVVNLSLSYLAGLIPKL